MKRLAWNLLMALLLLQLSVPAFSDTAYLSKQSLPWWYELVKPDGAGFVEQTSRLSIGTRTVFCLEPFDSLTTVRPYTTQTALSYISEEDRTKIQKIAYFGWYCSKKTDQDYFFTNLMIWEALGTPLHGTKIERLGLSNPSLSGYWTRRKEVLSSVKQLDLMPSFSGAVISLKVGETFQLEDTNKVFKDMILEASPANLRIQRNGNQLSITALAVGKSELGFSKVEASETGISSFWSESEKAQDVAELRLSLTYRASVQLTVEAVNDGSLQLTKTDPQGTPLAGAEFLLSGDDGQVVSQGVTDQTGHLTFSGLKYGSYSLKESKAPLGHVRDQETHSVVIEGSQAVEFRSVNETTKLIVVKLDPEGKKLPGARLRIVDDDQQTLKSWVSSGEDVFDGLPAGDYTLLEDQAPEGFRLAKPLRFCVSSEEPLTEVTLTDERLLVEISVQKTDSLSGEPLKGVGFTIKDESHRMVFAGLTNDEGLFQTSLPFGHYLLHEEMPLSGYKQAQDLAFTVSGPEPIRLSVANDPVVLKIRKTEALTHEPLSGAKLVLLGPGGGTVANWTSAEEAQIFYALPAGEYRIQETEAPAGYEMSPELSFLLNGTEDQEIEFPNLPIEKQVLLKKIDKRTGLPLAGVPFEISTPEGPLNLATDSKGQLELRLPFGETLIRELPYPGYIAADPMVVHVTDSRNEEVLLENEPIELSIFKADEESGEILSGAVLSLLTEAGELIRTFRSSAQGEVFYALKPGNYCLKEEQAPRGYKKSADLGFSVTAEGKQTLKLVNRKILGNLHLNKVDSESGEGLRGVAFEIIGENGKPLLAVTDETGWVELELPLGHYTIKEKAPIPGYLEEHLTLEVTLSPEEAEATIVFKNRKLQVLPATGSGSFPFSVLWLMLSSMAVLLPRKKTP